VVSVERRFTHGGILAALIDLAADWALVRQTGRGVPTYFLLQLLRSGFVQVFGCRPHDDVATCSGGRRRKTSKGGNRAGGTRGCAPGAMGI
jgi:hypothetical protein